MSTDLLLYGSIALPCVGCTFKVLQWMQDDCERLRIESTMDRVRGEDE
jgi:hypothetical protein